MGVALTAISRNVSTNVSREDLGGIKACYCNIGTRQSELLEMWSGLFAFRWSNSCHRPTEDPLRVGASTYDGIRQGVGIQLLAEG